MHIYSCYSIYVWVKINWYWVADKMHIFILGESSTSVLVCYETGCVNSMVAISAACRRQCSRNYKQMWWRQPVASVLLEEAIAGKRHWRERWWVFWSRQMRCQFSKTNIDMENQLFWWYFPEKNMWFAMGLLVVDPSPKSRGELEFGIFLVWLHPGYLGYHRLRLFFDSPLWPISVGMCLTSPSNGLPWERQLACHMRI